MAALGAAPAFADSIDDAAKKLSDAAYPFLKEVDWNSDIWPSESNFILRAISRLMGMGPVGDQIAPKSRLAPDCCVCWPGNLYQDPRCFSFRGP